MARLPSRCTCSCSDEVGLRAQPFAMPQPPKSGRPIVPLTPVCFCGTASCTPGIDALSRLRCLTLGAPWD